MQIDVTKFDPKKFLSLPLNNGSAFWCLDKGCGCIKGIFTNACGVDDADTGVTALQYLSLRKDKAIPLGRLPFSIQSLAVASVLDYSNVLELYSGNFATHNPKLQLILDRGEERLLQGRPQYAKLLVLRALRMFKFIPGYTETTEVPAKCELVEA